MSEFVKHTEGQSKIGSDRWTDMSIIKLGLTNIQQEMTGETQSTGVSHRQSSWQNKVFPLVKLLRKRVTRHKELQVAE